MPYFRMEFFGPEARSTRPASRPTPVAGEEAPPGAKTARAPERAFARSNQEAQAAAPRAEPGLRRFGRRVRTSRSAVPRARGRQPAREVPWTKPPWDPRPDRALISRAARIGATRISDRDGATDPSSGRVRR